MCKTGSCADPGFRISTMREAIKKIEGIGAYLAPQPLITVLDVKYLHLRMEDGTDLYITERGCRSPGAFCPKATGRTTSGCASTPSGFPVPSAVHRVRRRKSRVGPRKSSSNGTGWGRIFPGETQVKEEDADAEFNSPFLEFSLVKELQKAGSEHPPRCHTHQPLAIYVPRKYIKAEQLGRRQHKMKAIERSHREIAIDLESQLRRYL